MRIALTGLTLALLVLATATSAQRAATLILRIGALDGPDALGRVEAIEVDPGGRIYVLESDAQRVRVFSPTGQHLETIGREGSGPGEFRNPAGMTWGPDGHLWVIDPGNSRASVFDLTGNHVRDQRLEAGFELAPWPGRFDRAGRLYHYAADAASGEFGYVMVRYDRSMVPRDTIALPLPPEPAQFFETRTERWGTVRAAIPFAPKLLWRLGSDGQVWWAWTSRYAIFRGAQSQRPVIAHDVQQVPVTDAARDAAVDALDRFRRVGGRIDTSRIPDTRPALQGFILDEGDRVWSLLTTDGTDRTLEVHEADGTFVGRYELPVALASSPQPVVRANTVYGVMTDELDVPYVVVIHVPM